MHEKKKKERITVCEVDDEESKNSRVAICKQMRWAMIKKVVKKKVK